MTKASTQIDLPIVPAFFNADRTRIIMPRYGRACVDGKWYCYLNGQIATLLPEAAAKAWLHQP